MRHDHDHDNDHGHDHHGNDHHGNDHRPTDHDHGHEDVGGGHAHESHRHGWEHAHDSLGPGGGLPHDGDGLRHLGHSHGPGGHSHALPEGVAPLSRRGLLLLATAGGVVPSPSAVIVLVSAFTLGRAGLGLALVGAFSVGLAATLTVVGLALVYGSRVVSDRVSQRLVGFIPVIGAGALLVVGLVLTAQGARGL